MALFTISDLHLSLGANKPMDKFYGWEHYVDRIYANWQRVVGAQDTVVLPGDFSWGLKLEETLPDFQFLEKLNGRKILLKGNHDLWWSTRKKIEAFFSEHRIESVSLVHNSVCEAEGSCICGTRGWFFDDTASRKVLHREALRLELSLQLARQSGKPPFVFLHYPPVYAEQACEEIVSVLKAYGVQTVYHGHIHGAGRNRATAQWEGIRFHLVSCDCIDFTPYRIL